MNYEQYLDEKNPVLTIKVKDYGTMVIELFPAIAKNTVDNMVNLVQQKYFDGLIFHRIIKGFMIQGGWGKETGCRIKGDFSSNGVNNPLNHTRGVISMARTNDPNSATSQFFIMHKDSPHLDDAYAAFGVLIEGLETLDAIASVRTGSMDKPLSDVVIETVVVDTKGIEYDKPVCA